MKTQITHLLKYLNRISCLLFLSIQATASLAETIQYSGNSHQIPAYLKIKVNTISTVDGNLKMQKRVDAFAVLATDFGGRCGFFLKNPRQDIRRGSKAAERVYFKDITAIKASRTVHDDFTMRVFVGAKSYEIKRWSGMAFLKPGVQAVNCNSLRAQDLSYAWPELKFRIINQDNSAQWLQTNLNNVVEFAYDRKRAAAIYRRMIANDKPAATVSEGRRKRFERLLQEAQVEADKRKQQEQETQAEPTVDALQAFRASLAEGDDSHCGLVIEVRNKVVKVQTVAGEFWLKRKQLYPSGARPCQFRQGVYQESE